MRYIYGGMYSRLIVDDKTRLLCMVGNCAAIGEAVQGKAHMKGAMRNGATPREVLGRPHLKNVGGLGVRRG